MIGMMIIIAMIKNNGMRICAVIILLIVSSCNLLHYECCFLLLDGTELQANSVAEFITKREKVILFKDYQGFVGYTTDSILSEYTIIINNHIDNVSVKIPTSDYLEALKQEKIVSLKFNKIPETLKNYREVVNYLIAVYKDQGVDLHPEENGQEKTLLLNKKGQQVAEIVYSTSGVDGSFVTLMCNRCNIE